MSRNERKGLASVVFDDPTVAEEVIEARHGDLKNARVSLTIPCLFLKRAEAAT